MNYFRIYRIIFFVVKSRTSNWNRKNRSSSTWFFAAKPINLVHTQPVGTSLFTIHRTHHIIFKAIRNDLSQWQFVFIITRIYSKSCRVPKFPRKIFVWTVMFHLTVHRDNHSTSSWFVIMSYEFDIFHWNSFSIIWIVFRSSF